MHKFEIFKITSVVLSAGLCLSGQVARQNQADMATTQTTQETVYLDTETLQEKEDVSNLSAAKKVLRGYEPVRKGAAKAAREAEGS